MTVEELIEKLRLEDPQAKLSIDNSLELGGNLWVGDKILFSD